MICNHCGREIDDNAEVCFACGEPVDAVPAAETAQPEETQAAPKQEIVIDNAPKAGGFARFVSFVFALIGLILYCVKRKNGEDSKAVSIEARAGDCLLRLDVYDSQIIFSEGKVSHDGNYQRHAHRRHFGR